ncbi:diguanylate cyclase (GGDEF)-like protein/PAS domain S-box-containing protein [Neorhizobium galegae]|uniref:EAL domain-containing protein n=1 Tax=Rhizobium/Agrobacterium group TaxID=227290 RepID=UPI001AE14B9C|nr:EAL domain-containing protein [Neorhizobium galegae]MBP2548879.1 diguanylate cyclase (GGDEF)-like protein/PAS domain S-box-containing protein [Neorhizobium galegae]
MRHSVESRFIAIISGALLIVVAPLFTLFLVLSSQQATQSLRERVDIRLNVNAQALSKPLWDLDLDSIRLVTSQLIGEPGIRVVQVSDTLGKLDVTESNLKDGDEPLTKAMQTIQYRSADGLQEVGTLTIYYTKLGLFSSLSAMEIAFISIFTVAIITVFVTAILGNRIMVIRPLMRLTAAIEATRRLGSRHHVDWRSTDEIGRLAQSFNEMQIELEREEHELKRAHQQTTETYNLTPAMLFSLNGDDMIWAVSDYWLLATGYARADVLGTPFIDLIVAADRARYRARKQQMRPSSAACEVTVGFRCADGRVMDVLILETELRSSGSDMPTSLSVMTDVTELKQSEQRNRRQAISDHLTGLLNRQGFEAVLDEKIVEADATRSEIACLFIDLDRFKSINDTLGHAVGDGVLCQFAERIAPLIKAHDVAARLGGDEFALLITGIGAEERARDICQKIVDLFDMPFQADGTAVRLSASIGLAFYPRHARFAAELLQKSDMAMYTRKREGKNGAVVYNEAILDRARERAEIESDIAVALSANWFESHFQPIVDVTTRQIVGFEALMRLRHPRKGLLSPSSIIEVAEETGSINQIGSLILEDALSNLARLSAMPGMDEAYVAVNFSPLQFEPSLPARLAALIARHAILPHRLVLEITEAVLMHDDPEVRKVLDEIHAFGCRIALDDFGTGYSSLSYMSRFPVDIVKIDQSFIRSIGKEASEIGQKNRMLIEGISAISHKMNCTVIAEGVETRRQHELLKQIGVDCAQGFLFSLPRSIDDLMTDLSRSAAPLESLTG